MTVASLSLMQYKIFQFYSLPTYFTIFHDFRLFFFFLLQLNGVPLYVWNTFLACVHQVKDTQAGPFSWLL